MRAQRELTRHLRDPAQYPCPATLPALRVAVYRRAVIHNIERFMADNFPRIKEVFDPAEWALMIRDYVIRHRATTATFATLPQEFLDYLSDTRQTSTDPPFLYELAHFDWLENCIATDERRVDLTCIDPHGDLLNDEIAINPVHRVETYRFPILEIGPSYQPGSPPATPTHIVAFRDVAHQYCVLKLNALALRLFNAVNTQSHLTAYSILQNIATEVTQLNLDTVIAGGLEILNRMRQRGLVLGTRIQN